MEDCLITAQLALRPARAPDYQAESEALGSILQAMTGSPAAIFERVVAATLCACRFTSGGVSLLQEVDGLPMLHWEATTGDFAPLAGTYFLRNPSPGALAIDRGAPQLLTDPFRHFGIALALPRGVREMVLAPLRGDGVAVGTLWIVSHVEERPFDQEDVRLLSRIAEAASAAWQSQRSQHENARFQEIARVDRQAAVASQAALELTQARFAAFFEQAPFYAGMLSREGHVVDAARMALEVCGYKKEEIVGRLFWETAWWRTDPATQRQVQAAVAVAAKGERFQAVFPYVYADGSPRWVDFRLSPVFSAAGEVIFIIAVGIDISDRLGSERELAAVRKRLDAALIAADVGTYEWDVTANRLYGDANFRKIFDVPLADKGGASLETFLSTLHPEDREPAAQAVERSLKTGSNFETDYRILVHGGEKWINSRGRMVTDATGQVVSFFGVIMDITVRKRAEQDRARIADDYRRLSATHETVLSSTDDFAYVFDCEGRFLYANRRLLTVWARTLDQVVGKTCLELGYPPWHAEMHLREIGEVIATKKPIRGEVPFTGDSGISGIYDYIFSPVFDQDGEVEAIAGITRDVTERKRGANRDRLLVALDDATRPLTDPHAITQTSARLLGQHLKANRCAYADVEKDENTFNLTGDFNDGVDSIVGRYRFDQFGAECLRCMRAGQPYVVVDAEEDPRTESVRASYRATKIRSVICVPILKAAVFVGAMAVHQATPRTWRPDEIELVQLVASRSWESIERARVVRVLAGSEQRLRLAVDTGKLGVWEMDVGSRTLTGSDRCRAIYGRGAEEDFSFATFRRSLHPDDRERVAEAMERAIADREECDIEYRVRWPDGAERWVLMRGQASYAEDGSPRRMVGVSLDITSRKEAEREQIRLREEADRASRAKDDFLATLSHELRTPLNPVLLVASDAAREARFPADARTLFDMIRKNVELEARLIDDLLDLTSIVRGKLTINKQATDLQAVLTDALAAVQEDFAVKNIRVATQYEAAQAVVMADPVRLLQVFLNLLKNAAKFTPANGDVALSTRFGADDVVVEVTDSGLGLTSAELERVFGAFEQGDHASSAGTHRFGGLGLGLAISHRLIEMHQGSIVARSPGRNRGATFMVTLPLHITIEASFTPGGDASSTAPWHESSRAGVRILLVEDHEPTRRALEMLLRKRRHVVVSAGSIAGARILAEQHLFDVVISDLGLPDGDGTELMRELHARLNLRGIALTGYGMEQDVARCRSAGFVTHLTKPVRIEDLEAALKVITGTATVRSC